MEQGFIVNIKQIVIWTKYSIQFFVEKNRNRNERFTAPIRKTRKEKLCKNHYQLGTSMFILLAINKLLIF